MAEDLAVPYRLLHLPLLVAAAYGRHRPKLVAVLRDPVERWGARGEG